MADESPRYITTVGHVPIKGSNNQLGKLNVEIMNQIKNAQEKQNGPKQNQTNDKSTNKGK